MTVPWIGLPIGLSRRGVPTVAGMVVASASRCDGAEFDAVNGHAVTSGKHVSKVLANSPC